MKLSFLSIPLIIVATTASAQERGTPPKMPIAEIASQLNVSEDEAQNCLMPKGDQEKGGALRGPKGAPSAEQQAALLSCLQTTNSGLTAEKLNSVMQSYGPRAGSR